MSWQTECGNEFHAGWCRHIVTGQIFMKDGIIVSTGWHMDKPTSDGYYLGAWLRGGKWRVSELWFNPDSFGTGWWPTRGYLGQTEYSERPIKVEAWMPMPEYKP